MFDVVAQATYNRIMINFGWAAVYNTIAVPFAAGLLYPALRASIPPAFAGYVYCSMRKKKERVFSS
jgi:cation transport ATPase